MTIDTITDADDPRVVDYRALRDPELRRTRNLFIAESTEVIRVLLAAQRYRIRSLLLTPTAFARLRSLVTDQTVLVASKDVLTAITGVQLHRGGLALVERGIDAGPRDIVRPTTRRLVLLEDVSNPDNIGGIFRTARAFGIDGLLLSPGCADPLYRKSVRVSMGASLLVPWARDPEWPQGMAQLRADGIAIAALTTEATALDLEALVTRGVPERLALLLGNEGTGLSPGARAAADFALTIPMVAGIDSLNVAAAAAIALHRLRSDSGSGTA